MKKRSAKTISVFDFMKKFPNNESARKYLETIIWKNGVACPFCDSKNVAKWKPRKGHYQCRSCRRVFNVRTKTIFEGTKLELKKWLYAMYLHQTARKGISSLQLSKEIGCSQKTAWFVSHRLREAYKCKNIKLSGTVEIDETYIGGKEKNKHKSKQPRDGGGSAGKTAILGMREHKGKVKAMPIANTQKKTLHSIVRGTVRPGSNIYTDDNPSYIGALRRHKTVNHSAKEYVNGMAHTNGIESVWALLKRGYNGVYHNWSMKHCGRYVYEFAFRLNEGNCQVDTIDRIRDICESSGGKHLSYKELKK